MKTNWFIIINARGAWWIDNEGHSFGPFTDRNHARREAVTIARTFGDPQRVSCVFLPDDDGRYEMVLGGGFATTSSNDGDHLE